LKRAALGFTMVELVTVMVIVGILAALAIPRITQTSDFAAPAYRNEILSALHHAQKSAISHRHLVCATIAAGNVKLTINTGLSGPGCDASLASLGGNTYATQDNAVVASGAFVNAAQPTLFFQPNGEITDAAGNAIVAGSIGITGAAPIRIDGSTGHVE